MMKFLVIISGFMLLLKRSMVLADCDPNAVNCCPSSLGPVTIASTVSSIPNSAFYGCATLTSIDLTHVTSLGSGVFNGCTNLASVTLGNGITTLPDITFNGCSSLTSINLTHVSSLGTNRYGYCNAFNGCTNLATVTLGSALTILPASTFTGCSSLTSIDMTHVTSMGTYVFYGCSSLTSVTIGSGISISRLYFQTILSNTVLLLNQSLSLVV